MALVYSPKALAAFDHLFAPEWVLVFALVHYILKKGIPYPLIRYPWLQFSLWSSARYHSCRRQLPPAYYF